MFKFKASILLLLMTAMCFLACNNKGKRSEKVFNQEVIIFKSTEEIEQKIKSLLNAEDSSAYYFAEFPGYPEKLKEDFSAFYRKRQHRPAWVDMSGKFSSASSLLVAIGEAWSHGMDPEAYYMDEITQSLAHTPGVDLRNPDIPNLVRMDFLLTRAYLLYGFHLQTGRILKEDVPSSWDIDFNYSDLGIRLEIALQRQKIRESLMELAPENEQYQKLKKSLEHHRRVANKGGWQEIPAARGTIEPGDTSDEIPLVRKRLAATGELPLRDANLQSKALDETLVGALKKFQSNFGLESDGRIGKTTLKFLNIPAEELVQKIIINMERLKWEPLERPDDLLLVNIPDFSVTLYEAGKMKDKIRVIVGQDTTQTPVFHDTVEFVVFSPIWNVPHSIATKELLPMLQRGNFEYFHKHNLLIYSSWSADAVPINIYGVNWKNVTPDNFRFKIAQSPGDANSLGRIKFIFPNHKSVYLHDTPTGHLFSRDIRTYSHGCIRVQKPIELAKFLLRKDQSWDDKKILKYMDRGTPYWYKISAPTPIYITYKTAWVDESGATQLRGDFYGQDKIQFEKISERAKPKKEIL